MTVPSDFHISGMPHLLDVVTWSPHGKALNLALSYYPVARECLLAVVDTEQKGAENEGHKWVPGCQPLKSFQPLPRSAIDVVTAVFYES